MRLKGLTRLTLPQLERLLRAVHRGHIRCPLDGPGLMLAGLSDVWDDVEVLKGLDKAGVQAVVASVIAERRAQLQKPSAL